MFASDLDPASRAQLGRGQRLVELLKQPQLSPYAMEEQAVSIWTGTAGKLDVVPVEDIGRFEREFLDHLRRNTKILQTIRETRAIDDDTAKALDDAIAAFTREFHTGEGKPLAVVGREQHEALDEGEVEQEQIVRQRRG
jgi:F-type H+-transporting ATPase subunit alpha